MNFDALTEAEIDQLIKLRKRVTNPNVRWVTKPGHKQRNFKLEDGDYWFELYLRQSIYDDADFSCGLKVIKPDGQPLTLLRYNGAGHVHGAIKFQCHAHSATESAMRAGKKPESHAEIVTKYRTLDGALYCMVEDAHIDGLPNLTPDELDLFPNP